MVMDAAFAEIENADPSKSGPGRSGAGYEEARLEHFLFESRGSTERYRPYSSDKAMTFSAVWACGRIISSALSMIDWNVYKASADGKGKEPIEEMERSAAGDVAYFLNWTPNEEQTAMDWRQTVALDVLFEGNAYTFIDKKGGDRIQSLFRLEPKRVTPFRADGSLYYHVKNGRDEEASILTPSDLLHFRGLSPDGLVGYSVLSMARRTIELGLSQETFGEVFFERGPMPGGVLTVPGNLKQEDKTQLRSDMERLYGGSKNAGRVLVLGGNQTFTKMDLNNSDSQFLESRRFSVEDVCRWFGVPPHKLADLTRATFSNIEHQAIEFVVDCLMPWARRFESEVDLKLFGRINRGKFWTKHDFQEFLKGDSATLATSLSQQVNGGMRTINEARERLDLNPIEGGDTPLIQGAMIPLERALEEPEPPPPPVAPISPVDPEDPEAPAEEGDDSEAEPPTNLVAPLRLLFSEQCNRLMRVESDKARRANNQGRIEDWRRDYYRDHASVSDQYLPTVSASLAAFESDADPRKLADFIAVAHNRVGSTSKDILKSLTDKEWPAQFAAECVNLLWRKRK